MINDFLIDTSNNMEYMWNLSGWVPKDDSREIIQIECTETENEKFIYWYTAKYIDSKIIFDEIQQDYAKNWIDNLYYNKRKNEYPPIWDQLDAIWKWWQDMEDMRAIVLAVKDKYPKPL